MTPDIKALASELEGYVIRMRIDFYEHPELSGKEYRTREVLVREIESMNIPYRLLYGTGIIAFIEGEKPGRHRIIRADIDALPVQEETMNLRREKECISKADGICHTCGHDAHMAILLGTMKLLAEIRGSLSGKIYCCFEEGEETNCGIDTMINALSDYPVEECFALHVYSGLDSGKINVVPGSRMAGTVGIGFHLKE